VASVATNVTVQDQLAEFAVVPPVVPELCPVVVSVAGMLATGLLQDANRTNKAATANAIPEK
jgi:hypothetical protein